MVVDFCGALPCAPTGVLASTTVGLLFRNDKFLAWINQVGIADCATIGFVDALPLHFVAIEALRDSPHCITRLHGVGTLLGRGLWRWGSLSRRVVALQIGDPLAQTFEFVVIGAVVGLAGGSGRRSLLVAKRIIGFR